MNNMVEKSKWSINPLYVSNMKELLKQIIEVSTRLFSSPICTLLLVKNNDLIIEACQGIKIIKKQKKIPYGKSFSGRLIKAGKPQLIPDVKEYVNNMKDNMEKYYKGSLISAPLIIDEKIMGLINICYPDTKRIFTKEELTQLINFSHQISVAIQSQQIVDEKTKALLKVQKDLQEINVLFQQEAIDRRRAQEDLKKAYEELKQTQSQLIQSEKMAGIGQLAAGVAHEINNPTGYIICNLNVLEEYYNNIFSVFNEVDQNVKSVLSGHDTLRKTMNKKISAVKKKYELSYLKRDMPDLINESLDGAHRIKDIVSNLRGFAHSSENQFSLININKEIDRALSLVWGELKYKYNVVKDLKPLPKILCNPGELGQVFINLLVNAKQAIEHNNGKIIIKTYIKESDVVIEISDNGKGIHHKHLDKIFEPFFTTKEIGEGTGLGLSIAYGIIKNHQGSITVKSKVSEGTTFIIKLPIKGVKYE